MSRRGAGVAFCAIAAVLFVGWYVVAALFRMSYAPPGGRFDGTEVPRWLDYVGTDFRNLALLALVAGVGFLVWAELEAARGEDQAAGAALAVPPVLIAGALLAGLGGALLLIGVGERGHVSGRGGELLVLAGLLGLVAAALAPFRALASAVAAALTGVTVLFLGGVGPRPPTAGPLPPALLLAAAVIVYGWHVARARSGSGASGAAAAAQAAAGIGLLLHASLFVPLLTLGLGVPGWAILLLVGVWAAMAAVALRLRRDRPWWVLAVPAATAAAVAGLVALGGTLLGWTA